MNAERRLISRINPSAQACDIKIGDKIIHYVRFGVGPAVILLHGANIGWGMWWANIQELSKRHRVFAIDIPGCGGSTRKNWKAVKFDTDIIEPIAGFIEKMKIPVLSLVGHSFGGWIAMELKRRLGSAVVKTILVDSLGFTRSIPLKHLPITFSFLAHFFARIGMRPTIVNMRKFLLDGLYNKNSADSDFISYFMESIQGSTISHPLLFMNSLTVPGKLKSSVYLRSSDNALFADTLAIWGKHDPIMPLDKSIGRINQLNIPMEIFDKSGHVPPIEEPGRFNSIIMKFLSS